MRATKMSLINSIFLFFFFSFVHKIRGFVIQSGKCLSLTHRTLQLRAYNNAQGSFNQTAALFPLLPPSSTLESSSYTYGWNQSSITLGEDSQPVAYVAQAKFELQYTCNVCETRNSHKVSRLAYRKGVVIAVCKGCKSKHMIADNLGWTNYKGGFEGNTNIEEYMESKGRGENINRVSADVFSLEKTLFLTSPPESNPSEGFS